MKHFINPVAKCFAFLFLGLSLVAMLACSSGSDDDDGDSASNGSSSETPAASSPAASTLELAGTSWRILSVMRGSTSLRPSDGQELNIDFGSDGRVSGNSGCNRFSGAYRQSGDRVEIDSLGSTLIGCDGATTLLESAVVSALSVNGTISRVDDSIAVLSSSEASLQLQRR